MLFLHIQLTYLFSAISIKVHICFHVLFYAGNLHKWMFSCRSAAVLCVKPAYQMQIEPLVTSWAYPARVREHDFQAPFFVLGTRDVTAQVASLEAACFLAHIQPVHAFPFHTRNRKYTFTMLYIPVHTGTYDESHI